MAGYKSDQENFVTDKLRRLTLGMDAQISRRDIIHGAGLAGAGMLITPGLTGCTDTGANPPPTNHRCDTTPLPP